MAARVLERDLGVEPGDDEDGSENEILGTMWATVEGDAVDLSATKRPELRRTGVGTESVFGAIRLLNRHFGVQTITLRTAAVNAAANAAMRSMGFELIDEEVPQVSPGGIEYLENVFQVPIEGGQQVCRWGIDFGRDGWIPAMGGPMARLLPGVRTGGAGADH